MKIKNQENLSQEAIATMAYKISLQDAIDLIEAKFPNKDNEAKIKLLKEFIKTDKFLERAKSYMPLLAETFKNC